MKLMVILGIVGFAGIVASHFQTIATLRDERDTAAEQVRHLDQELTALTTTSVARISSLQQVTRDAAGDSEKLHTAERRITELEEQLTAANNATGSRDAEASELRAKLAKAEQAPPLPSQQRVTNPAVPMQPAPAVNALASRQAQVNRLKSRLQAAEPWEQALVEALDRQLASGDPVDSDLMHAANRSRLARDLIAIYGDQTPREYAPYTPLTSYQQAYAAASSSEQRWADGIKKLIESGATADDLAADPYFRQQAKTDPLVAALLEMARKGTFRH